MRTYLECIPCFFKQALEASKLSKADKATQKKVLDELSRLIPEIGLNSTPPEMGRVIYQLVSKVTGERDLFKEIKQKSNKYSLKLYSDLKAKIESSNDRLLTAVRLAIAGNVIDYGAQNNFVIEEEIENCLRGDFAIFDYIDFKEALNETDQILYLADNAGEVVFDKVLIEEIRKLDPLGGKQFFYVVRDKPVINDALVEDARACGIDEVAEVVSSGSDAPGTILELCSQEFLKLYEQAKMIISKGQGNFEAISEEDRPIFFLLKAKCPVIAKDIGCRTGDVILKSSTKRKR
ncbi:MAG: ARMT1-like domain-containing protein [Elusimicrobiota bacterium]|nr:ARMT1-like domain-containing protein [Elusimicrobiota bacterium]